MVSQRILTRPSYSDATPAQLLIVCNGVGSAWMPEIIRKTLTRLSAWFFDEASWNHHDFGYFVGCTERDRLYCDNQFFEAMRRDARQKSFYKMLLALNLSLFFYLMVRLFGWTSFYYGQTYQQFNMD